MERGNWDDNPMQGTETAIPRIDGGPNPQL